MFVVNQSYCANNETEVTSSSVDAALKNLLRRQWKIFRCSPLNGLKREKLGMHANVIAKIISRNLKKTINVNLVNCPLLRISDVISPGLKVEVIEKGSRLIYTAYFINWNESMETSENTECLPLVLVDANLVNCNVIHSAFQKTFDCVVTPVKFNVRQLVTLFALLVKFSSPEETGNARLCYNIPGLPPSDAVNASLRVCDVAVVMHFYVQAGVEDPGEIPLIFYKSVLEHLFNTYQLNLRYADLVNVALPYGQADSNGQVLMDNITVASPMLIALQSFIPVDAVKSRPPSTIDNYGDSNIK